MDDHDLDFHQEKKYFTWTDHVVEMQIFSSFLGMFFCNTYIELNEYHKKSWNK